MSYSEIYTRINWQNDPDTSTPLDAENLNKMDIALKAFDILIKTIGNDAMYAADVENCLYGQPTINQTTGVISFPKKGGGAYTLDTLLEKVIVNFDFDETTQIMTITLEDGTTKTVNLSSFIQETEFDDSSTIDFTVSNHHVTATVKAHSIGPNELVQDYLADCEAAVEDSEDAADTSADRAEDSEAWAVGKRAGTDVPSTDPTHHNNSKYYAEQSNTLGQAQAQNAESWAVGQKGGTDVPSTDPTHHNNSKYYAEQANTLGQAQAQNAEAWANGTRNGSPVPSTDPAYHNNAKYWKDQAQAVASSTFAGLEDVDFNNLQNGQVPVFNSTSQKWENGTASESFEITVTLSGGSYSCNKLPSEIAAAQTRGAQLIIKTTALNTSGQTDVIPLTRHYTSSGAGLNRWEFTATLRSYKSYTITLVEDTGDTWDVVAVSTVDLAAKADKVTGATNGHLAALNASGNLVDSGLGPDDVGKAYIASNTAPSNTKCFWIDTANGGIQKRYDGSAWVIVPAAWA